MEAFSVGEVDYGGNIAIDVQRERERVLGAPHNGTHMRVSQNVLH